MILGNLGPALFAAGFAALAGALFLLQRLRVRHREQRVPTLLFWKEAVRESRARVFVRRFRHPWAYALALAAAGLLWFASALPQLEGERDVSHLLVLDASGIMTRGVAFEQASERVQRRARELPRASTRVLLAAGRPLSLLAPGEPITLLAPRMRGLLPDASPSTLAEAVRAVAATLAPEQKLEVEIHGDGALDAAWEVALPERIRVVRVPSENEDEAARAGITAFGISEAASGRWDAVDLYVRVAGDHAPLQITLDAEVLAMTRSSDARGAEYRLADVVARGQRWSAQLAEGVLEEAHHATRLLPERAALRVGVSPRVRESAPELLAALAADSGVRMVEDAAELVVRVQEEAFGTESPALVLTDADSASAAFTVRGPAPSDAEEEVLSLFEQLGLREVDARSLASAAGRPIELRFLASETPRSVEVWTTLLSADYDFVQTRAFPLFLAAALRWLADAPPLRAEFAAGLRFPAAEAPLRGTDETLLNGAGAEFRLPRADAWTDARGDRVDAALLDPALFAVAAPSVHTVELVLPGVTDPLPWIGLLALVLLVGEWVLFRRGRIP